MTRKQLIFLIIMMGCLVASALVIPPIPPRGELEPYLNGTFSASVPGDGGSWTAEDAYPLLQVPSPLRVVPFPGSDDYVVLSKLGMLTRVNFDTQSSEVILDYSDRSFSLGEAGATGIAFHPKFTTPDIPEHQAVYLFYRYKPAPLEWSEEGFNRLSRFLWSDDEQRFVLESEEILIQQFDRSTWHNGGALFFGDDGYLYIALGDEGMSDYQVASTQRLDRGLFSGLLRIDVDKNASKSHPIIRQPIANATAPTGWGTTFTQGYFIPNDNPWLSPDGSHLEEFVALGLRSPYSTHYDEVSKTIWSLDVGSDKREEFNTIEIGDNLQWPFMEGSIESKVHDRPSPLIGTEKIPLYEYDRSIGNAVVGGVVYRGEKFLSLLGEYLHVDYIQHRLMSLVFENEAEPQQKILISDVRNLGLDLPEKSGLTGIHLLENGDLIMTIMGEFPDEIGKFLRVKQNDVLPDPPALLSELEVFDDLETLTPIPQLIPYHVNAPLWSDRAIKKRWMAIPNTKGVDKINFREKNIWSFPEGTVFIKHFELPLTLDDPDGPVRRLETRFFVLGQEGRGYGLTYKWNQDGTDAELLRLGATAYFDIMEDGDIVMTQKWDYPSRTQCETCHNANAGYVLGVNTHQLNSTLEYADLGMEMNQLTFLSQCGLLDRKINNPESMPRAYPIEDGSVDLELRIKSYLSSNCAPCHQSGGVVDVEMDLRFDRPVNLHNTIFEIPNSINSDPNNYLLEPGNHKGSELWIRDASNEENRMPPLSRNLVHQVYIDSLAKWIDGLEGSFVNKNIWTYPNPTDAFMELRLGEAWTLPLPYQIYDLRGSLVLEGELIEERTQIDLSTYARGLYFIVVRDNDETIVKKVIKI